MLLALAPPPPGLVDATTYACGVSIGDGAVHTVGAAPAGSCFAGVTTLAVLARIEIGGRKPFAFLVDDGRLTGPLATWAGKVNPFTSPSGAYHLTDASVSKLDIAWLAIQAAAIGGGTYLPTGRYVIGSSLALPIMLVTNIDGYLSQTGLGVAFRGDGAHRTVIVAGSSFGQLADGRTNIPLLSCGDPGATPANRLGRWYPNNGQCVGEVSGIQLWGDPAATSNGLASRYHTDGLALGARLASTDVESDWFYNDITLTGDHTLHTRLKASGGVFGAYWTPPNQVLTGDWMFLDVNVSGQSFASLRVDGAASIDATFEGETYLNAKDYAIFGDANGCKPILYATTFSHLMTEFLGLAAVHDEHVFNPATGAYTDRAKCRGAQGLRINYWFNDFDNDVIPRDTHRRRRAVIDVDTLSGEIRGIDTAGGGIVPKPDRQGAGGIALFNANRFGDYTSGIGLTLSGNLLATFNDAATAGPHGGAIPIISPAWDDGVAAVNGNGVDWAVPGYATGRFAVFKSVGNHAVSALGDVLQATPGYNAAAACCVAGGGSRVLGIAAEAGIGDGAIVPVQTGGVAAVNLGWHASSAGSLAPASGVGAQIVAPGAGGVARQ